MFVEPASTRQCFPAWRVARGTPPPHPRHVPALLQHSRRMPPVPTQPPIHPSPTGMYLGSFGPHGPELLHVERQMEGGQEYVVATKLTGGLAWGVSAVWAVLALWAACWKGKC